MKQKPTLTFDISHKIITVSAPFTELNIQYLYSRIKEWEAQPEHMSIDIISTASGKEEVLDEIHTH